MSTEARIRQDFEEAQLGRGTRLLTYDEASARLTYCDAIGWAYQFMESFECTDDKEIARIDLSILNLSKAEREAQSLADLTLFARQRLEQAQAEPNPFLARPDVIVGGREFAHLHPDGSLHTLLPPDLAQAATEAGWAVAHPWADQRPGWEGFVMIFTPANSEELDVVYDLVVQSYAFVTGSRASSF